MNFGGILINTDFLKLIISHWPCEKSDSACPILAEWLGAVLLKFSLVREHGRILWSPVSFCDTNICEAYSTFGAVNTVLVPWSDQPKLNLPT
jgi:hypothetical protein